jgi:hypothetical protein
MYMNSTSKGLHHSSFKYLLSAENVVTRSGPYRSPNFEFEELGKFETEFENNVVK